MSANHYQEVRMSKPITAAEVAALNAARLVCRDLERRLMLAAYDRTGYEAASCGVVAEAAQGAGSAIFNVLNCAQHNADAGLSYEQLHGQPEPRPEPEPAAPAADTAGDTYPRAVDAVTGDPQ